MVDLKAVQRPVSLLPIASKLSIPGSPDWVGIGQDAVWISNKAKNSIARIDPATNRLVATVPVGRAPCSGLGIGFGSVWVPSCGDRRIDRVDARSNQVVAQIQAPVGDSEGGIAVGESGVWLIADRDGTLQHIAPESNEVVARVQTAPGSFVPAVGADSVWVSSTAGNLVSRVDPQTHRLTASIPVGPSPRFLATSESAIWTLNQGDGTVSRIDPSTNRLVETIEVGTPGPGGDIAAGEGFIWVTAIDVPLTQIDPRTNKVVVQFVGTGGDALRVGHGSVWLCSFFLQEVWQVPLPL
jgi:virginiamycin B lyase